MWPGDEDGERSYLVEGEMQFDKRLGGLPGGRRESMSLLVLGAGWDCKR